MTKRIRDINQFLNEGKALQLVEAAEAAHQAQYQALIPFLMQGDVEVVCVAGPSSSGKTIFTNRLKNMLTERNCPSMVLSMDDYFYDREELKQDANGKYDFETVETVNVELFRKQLQGLLNGEAVYLPHYNFFKGEKEYDTMPTKLPSKGIVFVEGIHALNYDAIFGPDWEKGHFGIYIAPQEVYETESGLQIEPHQVRMVRRMVRDAYYRNCNMMQTLAMWESVRRGEEKWIFPFAKNAEFCFNSSLDYELCVLKTFFLEQYEMLPEEAKQNMQAYLNKKILEAWIALSAQVIPQASLLNEFIPRTS